MQKTYCVGSNERGDFWVKLLAQAAKNHGDEWDLTWYFWGLCTSIPTWTHSQNAVVAEAPGLKLSQGTYFELSQRLSQSAWELSKAVRRKQAPPFEFEGKTMETATRWSEFSNRGKSTAEQILGSEVINPKE